MRDERLTALAKNLVNYSVKVQPNENVLIKAVGFQTKPLVKEVVKAIVAANGNPFVDFSDEEVGRLILEGTTESRAMQLGKWELNRVQDIHCFIYIDALENDYEHSRVPNETFQLLGKHLKPATDIRVNERKWVLLNYPTHAAAQKAKMVFDDFYDYSLSVMALDYTKMHKAMLPLKELMESTDKVRIVGPGTDLSFSIKDMSAIPCSGELNIPDGEVFTAPIKDSVNGIITYNTPCPYQGKIYYDVKLMFENGKIIESSCSNNELNESLKEIFDTDEGARYVGEFAIGVNPIIQEPMGDILFDEKICGSIHFTPGAAYNDADNGNDSSIHWDMVLIQRPEYGGGQIFFDDVLIRDNGRFVLPELEALNIENLK